VYLDGSDDEITTGDVSALSFANNSTFTITAWVKPQDVNTQGYIFSKDSGGTTGYGMYFDGTVDAVSLANGSSASAFNSSSVFSDVGTWVFVVITYNGTTATYYRNGVAAGTASGYTFTAPSGVSALIGDRSGGNAANTQFDGVVDEIRVYNRVLTEAQVISLYGSGAVRLVGSSKNLTQGSTLQNGLIGLWTFDGGDIYWPIAAGDGVVYDGSGNNNTGMIYNLTRGSALRIGKLGQALVLDSINQGVVGIPQLAFSGTFTFSLWFKGVPATNQTLFGEINGTIGATPKIGFSGGNFFVHIVSTSDNTISAGADGVWHHLVVTRDSSNKVDLYLDGGSSNRLFSDAAQSGTFTLYRLGSNGNDNEYYGGMIDDARAYTRALSAVEVKQLYNLGQVKIR
jgi:hypothetical protein